MPVVKEMGTTVPYTVTGTGPGLVLLHGTSGDAETHWAHLVDRLTDARRVIVPDYAGSGKSTTGDGDLTVDLLVEPATAVIRDAGGGRVDLAGFSMGAVVAAAHPELVRRLILIAGWANSDDARFRVAFGTWARLADLDPDLSAQRHRRQYLRRTGQRSRRGARAARRAGTAHSGLPVLKRASRL